MVVDLIPRALSPIETFNEICTSQDVLSLIQDQAAINAAQSLYLLDLQIVDIRTLRAEIQQIKR